MIVKRKSTTVYKGSPFPLNGNVGNFPNATNGEYVLPATNKPKQQIIGGYSEFLQTLALVPNLCLIQSLDPMS